MGLMERNNYGLPVSPTTENMCCMSFFLPSRLHRRTITYGRASITSNFLTKLVISQTAILCRACYFWIPTDVPPSRVIFILFHSYIHLSFSHTLKLCTLCVLTEFNKNTWWWWWCHIPAYVAIISSKCPLREVVLLAFLTRSAVWICLPEYLEQHSQSL